MDTRMSLSEAELLIRRITFSATLERDDKRLIGRKFVGTNRDLPGLGIMITVAFFQGIGKCPVVRIRLMIWTKCSRALVGRFLISQLESPSKPGALFTLREPIGNWTSSRSARLRELSIRSVQVV